MTDAAEPSHPRTRPAPDSRDTRLKAALKANMARRKAQARARAAGDTDDGDSSNDNDNNG